MDILALMKLQSHISSLDSGSGDAKLIREAVNEITRLQKENDILREAIHPHPETKGTSPLVLYFTDAAERAEFVTAYQEVHPNAKSYNV